MKETRLLMGMPITVEITEAAARAADLNAVFDYFKYIDEKFSTYKRTSEIMQINRGELRPEDYSFDMQTVLALAYETKIATQGYFDIGANGQCDPSGLVKGWAIYNAAQMLAERGRENYYVEAGGDIQVAGRNGAGEPWSIGIRDPFHPRQIVKVVYLTFGGVATSGSYVRGAHIYNPKNPSRPITEIISLTVIGPNIYEADRFATAAFAMGEQGISFIENQPGLEGYVIDQNGIATLTSGFAPYTRTHA